ncbi:DUF1565 domain-containing protein [Sporolactobacillus shoreicorticis]|uniref:DUF1565 domain-containing protein n=1 Tax=Sporolactobacillus shoreicorticis TaxID=1923877 RepID=A0ABW5RYX6_9BACL|nr:DUF1565 domain-containing protein [Sporolactobacillus shoreicorticis]MCO7125165.1 DUF1565 domain-containing protein [Sporolactobacillus shoreicorticis]
MIYHVAKKGNDRNCGNQQEPFLTINHAAQLAQPGDAIFVHEGNYRERVDPKFSGLSDNQRITYQAVPGDHVVIKGSEVVTNWVQIRSGIWQAEVNNQVFGKDNPFQLRLQGDWLEQSNDRHTGDLYLNGQSFYEAASFDEMAAGEERDQATEYVTNITLKMADVGQTAYKWYAEAGAQTTTIFANFHSFNPNHELVEMSVRPCCFYPSKPRINFIAVIGFEMCQAATPWAPPTSEQIGLIGPHWSKGWVIKRNRLHDAKCSAISIGAPVLADENAFSNRHDRPGYQYQIERVFRAQQFGWDKASVGSHLIYGNQIYNCGQSGIVGNLGGIFSRVVKNHIYNIGTKYEFGGWEISAIKLHAAIDVEIVHNQIDHCVLGTWLDWQAQGTMVMRNFYHHNVRDFLIEVCHGPFLVADNIFASKRSIDEYAQGGAFVNNLIMGRTTIQSVLNRATPYHIPHQTAIKGYAMVYGGDDRYFNNIFIGDADPELNNGTNLYNGSPISMQDYVAAVEQRLPGDVEMFETVRQPVHINHNVYLNGAIPFMNEVHYLKDDRFDLHCEITRTEDEVRLTIHLPASFDQFRGQVQTTASLGRVRLAEADFENVTGDPLYLNRDYFNKLNECDGQTIPGPFKQLKSGENVIVVWCDKG